MPALIVEAMGRNNIPATNVRLNRRMLEEAYPADIIKSLGGVYPDTEIDTPSPDDSKQCFDDYLMDAQRRLQHDSDYIRRNPGRSSPARTFILTTGGCPFLAEVAVMSIKRAADQSDI